jgi:hypothetical protein
MNNIEKLNQLLEKWANTDPENKNKMNEFQKQIVNVRKKIADYPIELVNMAESIKLLKRSEKHLDNYSIIDEYLNLFEKYHIKYNKEINLMKPNTEEIIKEIWIIKEKEYTENPKYNTKEIKKIIKELNMEMNKNDI